jgi:predicted restriction endonuclease
LLCANHHLMFDRHQITISPDGIVRYRSSNPATANDRYDHAATTYLHGRRAFLPQDERYRPNASALESHYAIFKSKLAKAGKTK